MTRIFRVEAALVLALIVVGCGTLAKEGTMNEGNREEFFQSLFGDVASPAQDDSLKLFSQFIGGWKWVGTDYGSDGTKTPTRGRWVFEKVLDGHAIQDVFIFDNPEKRGGGDAFLEYGTTIRFPVSNGGTWKSVWIGPMNRVIRHFEGKQVGSEIIFEGKNERGEHIHWIFSDISPLHFHWRAEYSPDGGKTWKLYEDLDATRTNGK